MSCISNSPLAVMSCISGELFDHCIIDGDLLGHVPGGFKFSVQSRYFVGEFPQSNGEFTVGELGNSPVMSCHVLNFQ
jgi:hypothetical protein